MAAKESRLAAASEIWRHKCCTRARQARRGVDDVAIKKSISVSGLHNVRKTVHQVGVVYADKLAWRRTLTSALKKATVDYLELTKKDLVRGDGGA